MPHQLINSVERVPPTSSVMLASDASNSSSLCPVPSKPWRISLSKTDDNDSLSVSSVRILIDLPARFRRCSSNRYVTVR